MVHIIYINKSLTNKHLILSFFWYRVGEGSILDMENWHVTFLSDFWRYNLGILNCLHTFTCSFEVIDNVTQQIKANKLFGYFGHATKNLWSYLTCFFHWWPAHCAHSWLTTDHTGHKRADNMLHKTRREAKIYKESSSFNFWHCTCTTSLSFSVKLLEKITIFLKRGWDTSFCLNFD